MMQQEEWSLRKREDILRQGVATVLDWACHQGVAPLHFKVRRHHADQICDLPRAARILEMFC